MVGKFTDDQKTAYHEATHAIVSILSNDEFDHIKIGGFVHDGLHSLGAIVPTDSRVDHWGAYTQAKISAAGLIADKIFYPRMSYQKIADTSGRGDIQNVLHFLILHLFEKILPYRDLEAKQRQEVIRCLRYKLFPEVRRTVLEQWNRVVLVGDALIERRRLSYQEVLAVLGIDNVLMFFLRERLREYGKSSLVG